MKNEYVRYEYGHDEIMFSFDDFEGIEEFNYFVESYVRYAKPLKVC